MLGDVLPVPRALLEHDRLLAVGERRRVEGQRQLHVAVLVVGRELLRGRDGLAADLDWVARDVAKLRSHDVLAARHEVLVGHAVGDGGLLVGDHLVVVRVARGRVVGVGVDLGLHVVKRAEVQRAGVVLAGHGDLVADELAALVRLAGQLDEVVDAVGEGAEPIVLGGHAAVVRLSEPDARARAGVLVVLLGEDLRELVFVNLVLVGFVARFGDDGVEGVDLSARGGVDHAVLVGHDDVGLARGLLAQKERDVGHLGARGLVLLLELQVGAHYLVLERLLSQVDRFAVLADLEGHGLVGLQVARAWCGLGYLVGAVGQEARGRVEAPAVVGKLRLALVHHVACGVQRALHEHGVLGLVDDLEGGGQVGAAGGKRPRLVRLLVELHEPDVAAHHVVVE